MAKRNSRDRRAYYLRHRMSFIAHARAYRVRHRDAIKVARHLLIPIPEARKLLDAADQRTNYRERWEIDSIRHRRADARRAAADL